MCVYREREIFIVCEPHGYHKPKIYNRYTQKQRKVSNWYLKLPNSKDSHQLTSEQKKKRTMKIVQKELTKLQ